MEELQSRFAAGWNGILTPVKMQKDFVESEKLYHDRSEELLGFMNII
jgi:hypothetical protein